jgi:predicted aspartyl protease
MRTVSISFLLLLVLAGCSPFSGTRYADIPAEQYNYIKGQRVTPEEIGIRIVADGNAKRISWPLNISGDENVTLPLRLQGGAITTPVEVNGTARVPAVIDTGAPFNVASLALAYSLDLPVTRSPMLPRQVGGYGGASAECGWSLLKTLQLGNLLFTNSLVMVPVERFERVTLFGQVTLNEDQFVILGLDDMARMSYVTFDFPQGRFILERNKPFIRQSGESNLNVSCQVIPAGMGPILLTWITVDGKGPFPCRIDTGKTYQAPALTIPQQLAKELGYWKEEGGKRADRVGIGGSFETQRFTLKSFEIGSGRFDKLTADSHEGAKEFILGLAFLRQYRTTIDFRLRMISLEK